MPLPYQIAYKKKSPDRERAVGLRWSQSAASGRPKFSDSIKVRVLHVVVAAWSQWTTLSPAVRSRQKYPSCVTNLFDFFHAGQDSQTSRGRVISGTFFPLKHVASLESNRLLYTTNSVIFLIQRFCGGLGTTHAFVLPHNARGSHTLYESRTPIVGTALRAGTTSGPA